MLVTSVALLSWAERSAVFHMVQEKCVKNHADLQNATGLSLVTAYTRYLCSLSCKMF